MFLSQLFHLSSLALDVVQGRVEDFLFFLTVSLQKPRD